MIHNSCDIVQPQNAKRINDIKFIHCTSSDVNLRKRKIKDFCVR